MRKLGALFLSVILFFSLTTVNANDKTYLIEDGAGRTGGPYFVEKIGKTFNAMVFFEAASARIEGDGVESIDFVVTYKGKSKSYPEFINEQEFEGVYSMGWNVFYGQLMDEFMSVEDLDRLHALDEEMILSNSKVQEFKKDNTDENDEFLTEELEKEYNRMMDELGVEFDEKGLEIYGDFVFELVFTNSNDEDFVLTWGYNYETFYDLFVDGKIEMVFAPKVDEGIKADRELLEKLVNEANNHIDDKVKYDKDSYARFFEAYLETVSLLENENATSEEINYAFTKLSNAIEGLKLIEEDVPADKEDNTDSKVDNEKDETKTDDKANKKTPVTSVDSGVRIMLMTLLSSIVLLVILRKYKFV